METEMDERQAIELIRGNKLQTFLLYFPEVRLSLASKTHRNEVDDILPECKIKV